MIGKNAVVVFTLAALLCSCETKTGTGALVGGGIGAGTGALITHGGAGGILIGGGIGALAGGLIGSALDEQDRKSMEQQNPRTLKRIDQGEQLSLNDIKAMSRAGLSDSVIISQIRATNSVFYLSTADVLDLKQSGVSERVIEAMIRTTG